MAASTSGRTCPVTVRYTTLWGSTGDTEPVMPRVHRAISNLQSWLRGTHRSVSKEHLQVYLDEFVYRYNRRRSPMSAIQSLLGLESHQQPMTYRQIVEQGPHAKHQT